MILAKAPSNIALVKYMGKENPELNLPANDSISMTLDSLCSLAEVSPASRSGWINEAPRSLSSSHAFPLLGGAQVPALAEAGIERILRHVERVQTQAPPILSRFGISARKTRGGFELRTANTFPASAGIASSASSFAAVTLAVSCALAEEPARMTEAWKKEAPLRQALASIARQGSGSSCRSMEGPWVLWRQDEARSIESSIPPLADLVVLVGTQAKTVSSSEAHRRVKASPLWNGRTDRAQARIDRLRKSLLDGDLTRVARVAWEEMWEMHSLFHTCETPFTYWEPGSIAVLKALLPALGQDADDQGAAAPIVTMDAGPNVHLLVPQTQATAWKGKLQKWFPEFPVLEDTQGKGAEVFHVGNL